MGTCTAASHSTEQTAVCGQFPRTPRGAPAPRPLGLEHASVALLSRGRGMSDRTRMSTLKILRREAYSQQPDGPLMTLYISFLRGH